MIGLPPVKHEARAFDGSRPCSRDVIVNFIRKPLADGSDKGPQEISIMRILIRTGGVVGVGRKEN